MGIFSGLSDALAGLTPKQFFAAVADGNAKRVAAILKKKPEFVNLTDDQGKTPLHSVPVATSGDNVAVAELLLLRGADVNARDRLGWTPLHHMALGRGAKVIDFLIAKGADANATDHAGNTPLHNAAGFGLPLSAGLTPAGQRAAEAMQAIQVTATMALLANGADASAKNAQGETPLDRANKFDQPAVAEVLRRHGGSGGAP
jgi:ankyrin repeat protein